MKGIYRSVPALLVAVMLVAAPLAAQEPVQAPVHPNPTASSTVSAGLNDGSLRAESVGTGGYLGGGIASGLFLGLIGTGITYAIAASSDVSLPTIEQASLADRTPEYIQGYRTAYGERVKAKRKQSALTGGLIGTGLFVVLVLSAGGG